MHHLLARPCVQGLESLWAGSSCIGRAHAGDVPGGHHMEPVGKVTHMQTMVLICIY